ncbi:hypothetical protein BOX15_Mlig031791g2 [Macrostomum lignano]|uniref:Uncharacterized protein n=1 Tax=Macrostomum lignano TaxID=282301 RepID=A0A267EKJ6_9PLAT|nr:hypothetical protein BOX15_Mlig031791g2 [Macrostomum lignano]
MSKQLQTPIPDFSTCLAWVKLVSAGFPGSGKTCLIKHFCDSRFSAGYQPTVGADYGFKVFRVDGIDLRVNMWDLSGYPEYLEVRNELYSGCDGVLLTIDLTEAKSVANIDAWMREIAQCCLGSPGQQQQQQSSMPDIVLLANKADLKDKRQVTPADAAKAAAKHKLHLYETSAATGEGVDKAFRDLLQRIVQRNRAAWAARGVKME